jgi:TMEM175 potassium channel family protein
MSERAGVPEAEVVSIGRVEALSDGVFAIVITLLVLEMKVPHLPENHSADEMTAALVALSLKFVSWVISFATVCVIWLNHHRLFRNVRKVDHWLFWLNANLLLWTSFIPFPTALMGDYPSSRVAASFYGAVMLMMALAFVLIRLHILRHPDLLHESVDRAFFRKMTIRSVLMGPVAYGIGALLAWVGPPLAFLCYAFIAGYFVVPRGRVRTTAPPGAPVPQV